MSFRPTLKTLRSFLFEIRTQFGSRSRGRLVDCSFFAFHTLACYGDQAKFDAVMNSLPMRVLSITNRGTTATVTALGHPYATGNLVLIGGATGADATHYNGPFHDFERERVRGSVL